MQEWFQQLHAKRKRGVAAMRENNWERGIWQSTVEKYADPTHFVYELLQNAEDQGATIVKFVLMPDHLLFGHNGQPFTRTDVENITGIGNSEKPQQANKIGRFGIGFKSVFMITREPRVYSSLENKPFAFAIADLVVPELIEETNAANRGAWTYFQLPFDPLQAAVYHDKVSQKLRALGADTLLFLDSLTTINWATGSEVGVLRCQRDTESGLCRLAERIGQEGTAGTTHDVSYLLFSKLVNVAGADRALTTRIAFRIEENRIVAERGQGMAYVYFPTREKTGLKFRLHAPFLLNDSRANIKDNCPENSLLIKTCAQLLAETLPVLRDNNLLTVECLECLPTREQDFDGSPFRPLFEAVRQAFKTQELLPTGEGSKKQHVKASHAKITDSRPLKGLLNQKQLTDLYGILPTDPVCWLSDRIQKTVTKDLWDYLIRQLEVEEVDSMKFARRLNLNFIAVQSDAWIISFYDFLNDQSALWRAKSGTYDAGPLRHKPILRLEAVDGNSLHIAPFADDGVTNAFLPTGSDAGFRTVKRSIASDEEALKFLVALGLKTPDVVDRVIRVVLPRYRKSPVEVSAADYAADLAAIADAITNARQGEATELDAALRKTPFVRALNAADKTKIDFRRPVDVYRLTQDVLTWFEGNPSAWLLSKPVRENASWPTILKFINRNGNLIVSAPRVRAECGDQEGYVAVLDRKGCHLRGLNGFDPRADIDGLTFALEHHNPARARLLWQMLLVNVHLVKGVLESSKYTTYEGASRGDALSALGDACTNTAWLPDLAGKLHKPADIQPVQLPADFDKKHPNFKEMALKLGMSIPEEEAVADKLGVPADILMALVSAWKRNPKIMEQITASQRQTEFPTSDAPYSDRRAEKVAEESRNAPSKVYEQRERSVRVSDSIVRSEAKSYLRAFYTNLDGELVCQICEQEMPFKLPNGDYYFEAVECVKKSNDELKPNFLALCPVCAAKYNHANGTAPQALLQAVLGKQDEAIAVVLAQEPHTIRFHPHHLNDLRCALNAADET